MPKKSTKSTMGGRRAGAGRPSGAILNHRISGKLATNLIKLADADLITAMGELLRGVVVADYDKDGTPRIYRQPPNAQICMYVADRVLGKMATPITIPDPPERRDDGFSTLILGDSAIRELAQHLFAAMGARYAGGLGPVREPGSMAALAAPDDGQRRPSADSSG